MAPTHPIKRQTVSAVAPHRPFALWSSGIQHLCPTTMAQGLSNISFVISVGCVLVITFATFTSAYENCQTLLTEIQVIKEKTYEYNGRRIRLMCAGNVMVNKCEGACTSEVSPSVVHFPGFKKVSFFFKPSLKYSLKNPYTSTCCQFWTLTLNFNRVGNAMRKAYPKNKQPMGEIIWNWCCAKLS